MKTENEKALTECLSIMGDAATLAEIINDEIVNDVYNSYQMMRCAGEMVSIISNTLDEARDIWGSDLCGRVYIPNGGYLKHARSRVDKWAREYEHWDPDYIFPYNNGEDDEPAGGPREDTEPGKVGFYKREIERVTDELARLKSGDPEPLTDEQYLDALDNEYNDLFTEYCDLYEKKNGILPRDEAERRAHNRSVHCLRELTDAEAVSWLKSEISDLSKLLELSHFGDLDKMPDSEKKEALDSVYSFLAAELYGATDSDKVEKAEAELEALKGGPVYDNLPFV